MRSLASLILGVFCSDPCPGERCSCQEGIWKGTGETNMTFAPCCCQGYTSFALQMGKREGTMIIPSTGEGVEAWALGRINTRSQASKVCHGSSEACISLDPAVPLLGIYPKEIILNV